MILRDMRDIDKRALVENACTVVSKIQVVGEDTIFTEDDCLVSWKLEDFRYVPQNGFIGQFVEKLLDGVLHDVPQNVVLENKELKVELGIKNGLDNDTVTFYDIGKFIVTKVEKEDTSGELKFETSDYTKKFNIQYVPTVTFPVTANRLLNDVSEQVGVELDSIVTCSTYAVTDAGLNSGTYTIKTNNKYYKFTLNKNLKLHDSLLLMPATNEVTIHSIGSDFKPVDTKVTATVVTTAIGTVLECPVEKYMNFANNLFSVVDNQFDNMMCRDVVKAIAGLGYTWARVNEENKLCLDFSKKTVENVDVYNTITPDHYYTSVKPDLQFGPVNKILIGMSNVDGENQFITDGDPSEDEICEIAIYDNPITYTEELRKIALYGGASRLFGLSYTPVKTESIGHIWLSGDSYIKLENVNGENYYSYAFDRTINYTGYLSMTIETQADTKIERDYAYDADVRKELSRVQMIVDKQNKEIRTVVEGVKEISDVAVSSVKTLFARSSSETEFIPTTPWSEVAPPRFENEYIWQKTVTTYANSEIPPLESEPTCISGADGKDGAPGAVGPQGPQGPQGPEGDITEAVEQATAAATNIANSIDFGGRNLLYNTRFVDISDKYSSREGYCSYEIIENGFNDTTNSLKVNILKTGSSGTDMAWDLTIGNCASNTAYILSGYVKSSVPMTLTARIGYGDNAPSIDVGTTWERFEIPNIRSGSSTPWHQLLLYTNGAAGTTIEFALLKLEDANRSTDWSPAPEDDESAIDILQQDVSSKADAKEVDALSGRVDNVETTANSASADIDKWSDEFDDYRTNNDKVVLGIESRVSTVETDSKRLLEFEKKITENGVEKLSISTGYTFDINGLRISSDRSPVNSTLNETGLSITDKRGDNEMMFVGYDKNLGTVVKVNRIMINDKVRFETYTDEYGNEAVGCFWLG